MRVVWTTQARDDIAEVREYIARNSVCYADIVAAAIVESVTRLSAFPFSGRIVPEIKADEIREVIGKTTESYIA